MLMISYLTMLIIKLKACRVERGLAKSCEGKARFSVQNVVETVWTSRGRNWASHLGFQAYVTPTSAVCSRYFGAVGVSKDQNSPQQTRSLWRCFRYFHWREQLVNLGPMTQNRFGPPSPYIHHVLISMCPGVLNDSVTAGFLPCPKVIVLPESDFQPSGGAKNVHRLTFITV